MNNSDCELEPKPVPDTGSEQDDPEAETFVRDKTRSEYVKTQLGRSPLV